jgi:hypothetical protein
VCGTNEDAPLLTDLYKSFIFFGFLVAGEEIESEWHQIRLLSYLLTPRSPT